MAALGDEGDGLAGQVLAEDLEGVEVGVGPEDVEVTAGDDLLHLVLEPFTLRSHLGESGREHDRELGPGGHRVAQDGQRFADEDGDEVQLLLYVGEGLGAGASRHDGAVRIDEVHRRTRSSAHTVIFWSARGVGLRALVSDAPTTATRLGRKKVSRSMERRAVRRPVMSGWPSFAVVPGAMSLPRAGPLRPCSLTFGRRDHPRRAPPRSGPARRGPAGAFTVYDVGVSVDPGRRPIVPGGGRNSAEFRPPPAPLR